MYSAQISCWFKKYLDGLEQSTASKLGLEIWWYVSLAYIQYRNCLTCFLILEGRMQRWVFRPRIFHRSTQRELCDSWLATFTG
jgi:hypothetical protein